MGGSFGMLCWYCYVEFVDFVDCFGCVFELFGVVGGDLMVVVDVVGFFVGEEDEGCGLGGFGVGVG